MYIVVENAGYEGERDVARFAAYRSALNYVRTKYDESEREDMHVAISYESANGERSYQL